VLAAIGLGTAVGLLTFGVVGVVVALVGAVAVIVWRRRRAKACAHAAEPVAVAAPTVRAPRT
jgi:hypothetical protein